MFAPFPIEIERLHDQVFEKPEPAFLVEIDHSNNSALIQRENQDLCVAMLSDLKMKGTFALVKNQSPVLKRIS